MSFFKSMFRGKKENKPATPSKRPDPRPPRSAEKPAAAPGPDLEGSMFAGLNVKSKENVAKSSPEPAPEPSGGLDMFSGMVLKAESKDDPPEDPDDGPSLLNMLNGDGDEVPDTEQQGSGFSFMEEPSLDDGNDGAVDADQQAKESASAFDFLMGTPSADTEVSLGKPDAVPLPDAAPEPELEQEPEAESTSMFDLSGLTLKTGATVADDEPEEGSAPPQEPEPIASRPVTRRWGKPKTNDTKPSVQEAMKAATPIKRPAQPKSVKPAGDSWEAIRGRLTSALVNYWATLRDIRSQQSNLRQREISNQNTFLQAQKTLEDLDAQQSEAIEQEEYDRAEQINDEIEQTRKRMKAMRIAIDQAARKATSLKQQETNQTRSLLEEVERSIQAMHTYQNKQEVELNKFVRTESLKLEDKEDRLNMETNRIERHLNHLNTDLSHVEEEEAEIEQSIAAETSEVEKEKDELMLQEHTISQEVEDLRRQLEAKEQELADCQKKLRAAESQIEKSRTKYKRTLDVVQQKRQQIVSERMDTVREQEKFEQERLELEAEREAINQRKKSFDEIVETIRREQKRSDALAERLKAQKPSEANHTDDDGDERKVVAELLNDLKSKSDAVEARSRDLIEVETKLADEQRNVQAAERSVPELQSQKKLAVKSKNFKKAGAISKEIKELEASKAASLDNMKSIEQQVKQISQEIQDLTEEKQALQSKLNNAERDSDIKRIKVVLTRKAKIQVDLARCTKELDTEPDNPALQAERETLEADIGYCEAEATEIRAKHQWTEDFPNIEVEQPSLPDTDDAVLPLSEGTCDEEPDRADQATLLQNQLDTAETELQEADAELQQWEAELEAALEEEDFDKCDTLNDSIEGRKQDIERLQSKVAELKEQLASVSVEQEKPVAAEEMKDSSSDGANAETEAKADPAVEEEPQVETTTGADAEHVVEESTTTNDDGIAAPDEMKTEDSAEVEVAKCDPSDEVPEDNQQDADPEPTEEASGAEVPAAVEAASEEAAEEPSSFDFLQDDDGDEENVPEADDGSNVPEADAEAEEQQSGFDFVNE